MAGYSKTIDKPERMSTLVSKSQGEYRTRKRKGKSKKGAVAAYSTTAVKPKMKYSASDRKKVRATGSVKNPYGSGKTSYS